jgi:hypothetical protein
MKRSSCKSYKTYKKHNSTRRSKYRKKNRHTVRKYKGGKLYTIINNKKRTYTFKGTITNVNRYNKYDEKTAIMLIKAAIPEQHLKNKAFQFGNVSLETFLKDVIITEWNTTQDKPQIDMLLRSANHGCTHEIIEDTLFNIMNEIHRTNFNNNQDANIEKNLSNPYYNKYIPYITKQNSNIITINPMNIQSKLEHISFYKLQKFRAIGQLVAFGFMYINHEWFEPENWRALKVIPTIKKGLEYRLLCKLPDVKKKNINSSAKIAYGNKMIAELLGPEYTKK